MADETTDRENEEEEIEELDGVGELGEEKAAKEAPAAKEEAPAAGEAVSAEPREQYAEVESKFDEKKDCAGLLYAPLAGDLTYRRTRCYRFKYTGSQSGVREFIRRILVDRVSQEVALDGKPALDAYRFYLDYGMKKGVLDLEREAIMKAYEEIVDPEFAILELELSTRIYVYGTSDPKPSVVGKKKKLSLSDLFVRDVVNPAIHRWSIHDERSIA